MELALGAIEDTLTESRYNEILDVLLPSVSDSPEAAATLKGCGEPEWKQRRFERLKKISVEAA
jgi:hypothetical protein